MHIQPSRLQSFRRNIFTDLLAGASGAAAGAPLSMGFAIIAGVSPIYGLYTTIVATIVGALATSSVFLTVSPTNALVLVVGSTLSAYVDDDPLGHLFTLTVMVGVVQLLLGLLRAGHLFRFVSNAVMTGFVSGAGLLIIVGQLHAFAGLGSRGTGSAWMRIADWLQRLPQIHPQTLFIGLLSIALILALKRTRLKYLAMLTSLLICSGLAQLAGWDQVLLTGDLMAVPAGMPQLVLPVPAYVPELALAAVAIALLASLQSAGLTRMIPQPDGSSASVHGDLTGQGLANIAGGLFQGLASGGSLSRTAINISAGARSRMANVFAGLFIAAILIAFGPIIESLPLAALAGQLIVAATSLIRLDALGMAWRVNLAARGALLATLCATLVFPLEYSVYIGIAISLMFYAWSSARSLQVRRLVTTANGAFREEALPSRLPDHKPLVVSVAGNLYFAAVPLLEERLPQPDANSQRPVVVLRLRDNIFLGSTGIRFLKEYARKLEAAGGRLLLAGVSHDMHRQLERTGETAQLEPLFLADEVIFASTRRALAWAESWLQQQVPGDGG